MKVRIKRIDKDLPLPEYQTKGSTGFDFYCREDTIIPAGQAAFVPANNVIEAPKGYFLAVLPRSSTFKKTGLLLANSMGVIDRDYAGPEDEVKLYFHNTTDNDVAVKKGDRLAQGLFLRFDQAEWNEVDEIREESRGGFGSTGR